MLSKSSSVKNHIESVHDGKTWDCEVCGKSYKAKSALLSHEKKVHQSKKTYFQCDICRRKFQTEQTLSIHTKQKHSENEGQ